MLLSQQQETTETTPHPVDAICINWAFGMLFYHYYMFIWTRIGFRFNNSDEWDGGDDEWRAAVVCADASDVSQAPGEFQFYHSFFYILLIIIYI